MGIRLHQCIGYGFDDYQGDDDPRFQITMDEFYCKLSKIRMEDFIVYLKMQYGADDLLVSSEISQITSKYRADNLGINLRNGIVHHTEPDLGFKNVVIFIPLNESRWNKCADSVDIEFNSVFHKDNQHKPEIGRGPMNGFWPYTGHVKNIKTGNMSKANASVMDYANQEKILYSFFEVKNYDEAKKYLRPPVPGIIKCYNDFLGLVKEEYIDHLVPLVYKYWL